MGPPIVRLRNVAAPYHFGHWHFHSRQIQLQTAVINELLTHICIYLYIYIYACDFSETMCLSSCLQLDLPKMRLANMLCMAAAIVNFGQSAFLVAICCGNDRNFLWRNIGCPIFCMVAGNVAFDWLQLLTLLNSQMRRVKCMGPPIAHLRNVAAPYYFGHRHFQSRQTQLQTAVVFAIDNSVHILPPHSSPSVSRCLV
jgi:hypothetical protein